MCVCLCVFVIVKQRVLIFFETNNFSRRVFSRRVDFVDFSHSMAAVVACCLDSVGGPQWELHLHCGAAANVYLCVSVNVSVSG